MYLVTCSPTVLNLIVSVFICEELPVLAGGEVSLVGVVELVGVTRDVVLKPGEVKGDAFVTGVAALTAVGLHDDPLEEHGAGGGRTLMGRRIAVGTPGGAEGDNGVGLRVVILTTWKICIDNNQFANSRS